mgnify:CR=1 FL=1
MGELRAHPPASIGGSLVIEFRDIAHGTCTDLRTGQVRAEVLPMSNVLAMRLESGERVLARPSGTEPKIKFYFEARVRVGPDETLESARTRADQRIQELKSDLIDGRFSALV